MMTNVRRPMANAHIIVLVDVVVVVIFVTGFVVANKSVFCIL